MKSGMVPLKETRDRTERLIGNADSSEGWNDQMLPRNQREPGRGEAAANLSDENDLSSAEAISQMSGGKRKPDHRDGDDQTDKTKSRGRMGARVDLPLHRHRQHLPADDGKKIARAEESVGPKAKGRVRIMRGSLSERRGDRRSWPARWISRK